MKDNIKVEATTEDPIKAEATTEDPIKVEVTKAQRCAALRKRESTNPCLPHSDNLPVAFEPMSIPRGPKIPMTVAEFIPANPNAPPMDSLAKERRRRLIEFQRKAFPDGEVPVPFNFCLSNLGC